MAVYKVLQDIEGEDKLIAWLTPKQTIYAAIVVVCGILAYFMGKASIFLALPWIFPIVAFGFLAAPLGRDQPNDVWLAAQIRFYIKNRRRVWDQTGMQELVHITVPKRIERIYTDGLNQTEVRSRLRALSATIDSRGWAVKNTNINMSVAPQFASQFQQQQHFDDRLVGTDAMAHEVPISDVSASEDIMDAQNNSIALRFDQQIKQQEELRKQALKEAMQNGTITYQVPNQTPQPRQQQVPKDCYFMRQQEELKNKPKVIVGGEQTPYAHMNNTVVPGQDVPEAGIYTTTGNDKDPNAQALLEKIRKDKEFEEQLGAAQVHGRTLKTPAELAEEEREKQRLAQEAAAEQRRLAAEEERRKAEQAKRARMMATHTAPDAIIKELSRDSELKVSTLASQAKHAAEANNDGEVVISLH